MIIFTEPPPGFPDDDDGSEDGGGPPRCDFCHAPAHFGACAELVAFTRSVKARTIDLASNIIGGIVANDAEQALFEKLHGFRQRIAQLRAQNCHVTASIMRDELLCQIETYLDPQGGAHAATLRAIQGRAAVELALAVDPACGF